MSRPRRRIKTFDKVAAVKSNARDRVGSPKATKVITPKDQKPPRHKERLIDLLEESSERNDN